MRIPKAQYHIGDAVNVRIEEAGYPPTFPAWVCEIQWSPRTGLIEYTVIDESRGRTDGYTESWLSPANASRQP